MQQKKETFELHGSASLALELALLGEREERLELAALPRVLKRPLELETRFVVGETVNDSDNFPRTAADFSSLGTTHYETVVLAEALLGVDRVADVG